MTFEIKGTYLNEAKSSWFFHIKNFASCNKDEFDRMWNVHPAKYVVKHMYGRPVNIARYVGLYGKHQYYYSKEEVQLLSIDSLPCGHDVLEKIRKFNTDIGGKHSVKYDTILVNWYDSSKNHYISPHSDETTGLVRGSLIYTVSFGTRRKMVIRSKRMAIRAIDKMTIWLEDGDLIAMGGTMQMTHTHSIPKPDASEDKNGKRVSFTIRAYK